MRVWHLLLAAILLILPLAAPSSLNAQPAASQTSDPMPPLGWSSWNSFSNLVNSAIVEQQAQTLVNSGLAKAGYRYVNIDEGWWLGTRDSAGNIVVEPERWPAIVPGEKAGEMSNIVRYIHGLGLKAGIYTDAGESGCSFYGPDLGPPMPHTGSEGHYAQDFLQFARWGFDYVKVDWCGGAKDNLDPAAQYAEIAHAISQAEAATGHKLYYSICNWGSQSPWTWAPGVGGATSDVWRTGGDIVAPVVANTVNANRKATFTDMVRNFDNNLHPEAQHTGFYNDADMMVAGMSGLSEAENRVHVSLWAISSSPMILGADLAKLNPETLKILANPEILAIDQDPLGLQPVRLSPPSAAVEVWDKVLADSKTGRARRAIVLLNRTKSDENSSLPLEKMSLTSADATVRDLWNPEDGADLGVADKLTVPAGNARLLLAEGAPVPSEHFAATLMPGLGAGLRNQQVWVVSGIKVHSQFAVVRIAYKNIANELAQVVVRIDGDRQTAIALRPTGSDPIGQATLIVKIPVNTDPHEISFTGRVDGGLSIVSLELQPIGY